MPAEADRQATTLDLEKFRESDREAVEELLGAMKQELEAYGARLKFSPADVNDLVSESLAVVWARRQGFDGDEPGLWAFARNTLRLKALNQWRRNRFAKARDAGEEAFTTLGVHDDPTAGLESAEQSAFLADRIPMLSAAQSLVVLLRLTNHDWDEVVWICSVAEENDVTKDAVQRRYANAVEKLSAEYARIG